ncbi:MAG: hypothetical protein ACRC35_00885 [Angustibacter sp.]
MRGRWRMALGPVAVSVTTPLGLAEAAAAAEARGESVLYTLDAQLGAAPTGDGSAHVMHIAAEGAPCADFDAATATLWVYADASDLDAQDLLYLSYLVLEAQLHQHGYVTLHASAVERDGRAVLLLGTPGAGKTTTALRLCRDHGCRLIGNDLVVVGGIDGLSALAGTTHLRLRHSSISQAMPELLGFFPPVVTDPWRTKVDVPPRRLGIGVSDRRCDLATVAFVHVDSGYPRVVTGPGDTLAHRLNLHENALRYIRGASTPWLVGPQQRLGPYVPSLDSPAAHTARTATLRRMLADSHYVAGPSAAVADTIADMLGRALA